MARDGKQLFWEYLAAVKATPQLLSRRALQKRTLEEELQEALVRGSLRKAFGGFDLLLLGLGIVIGSGWARLSGTAAEQLAGPSVIISYLFSGVAALFAAACYAELATEYPLSGGGFSYIMVTFGELPAFLTLAGLLLEYTLGMAVEARGFSRFLARLCNQEPTFFRLSINGGSTQLDFMAVGVVLLMSVLLSLGVRESALFIAVFTIAKVALLIFISSMGYAKGSTDNLTPFLDPVHGADGIFLGAAVIFFAFTGFDAIGNAAEEAQHVVHLAWALMGTVAASALLYFMLALALVLMVFPNAATPDLAAFKAGVNFVTAFAAQNASWMQYIVSVTALFGCMTALTVGLFSASRIVMVASRDWLLPPSLARISPRTQAPVVAQMVLGVIIGLLAFLVDVQVAASLVSFGALFALWLVCNAQLYRRYFPGIHLRFTRHGTVEVAPQTQVKSCSWVPGSKLSLRARKALVYVHCLAVNVASIALAAYYRGTSQVVSIELDGEETELIDPSNSPENTTNNVILQPGHQGLGPMWFALGWAAVTLSFQLCCPMEYEPTGWHVPWWLMPWLPSASIGLLVFSVASLPNRDYWKIGVYFGVAVVVYLLYSLPMSYIKHSRVDYVNTEELHVVELAFVDGQWGPKRSGPVQSLHWTPTMSSLPFEMKGTGALSSSAMAYSAEKAYSGGSGSTMSGPNGSHGPVQGMQSPPVMTQPSTSFWRQYGRAKSRAMLPPTKEDT